MASTALPARSHRGILAAVKKLFAVQTPLSPRARSLLGVFSFVLPLLLWSIVSYVPFVWHPQILITTPGDVSYLKPGMRISKAAFATEVENMTKQGGAVPEGSPANPIYLPAPDEVVKAFYTSFMTPPRTA